MDEHTALVPLTDGLPELRDAHYAVIVEWDRRRMALQDNYDAADGEYLKNIRDALKATQRGLWTRYLEFRNVSERTARQRIQAFEGRYERSKPATVAGFTQERPTITEAKYTEEEPAPPIRTVQIFEIEQPEKPAPRADDLAVAMYRFMNHLSDYRHVTDEVLEAWLSVVDHLELDEALFGLQRLDAWMRGVLQRISAKRHSGQHASGE